MLGEHPELAALLLEEVIAFVFAGTALLFIAVLIVLLRRENRGPRLEHAPPAESLASLKDREVDILEIYDDVVVIPPPRSLNGGGSTKPHLVRRTAKVRDRRSGNVYLTRLTAPTEETL
ncbi:MAG: hypothetical protein JJU00_17845 [Opitutales bacterium]|nr:hypothetical protein [Opitutales bacterium]